MIIVISNEDIIVFKSIIIIEAEDIHGTNINAAEGSIKNALISIETMEFVDSTLSFTIEGISLLDSTI